MSSRWKELNNAFKSILTQHLRDLLLRMTKVKRSRHKRQLAIMSLINQIYLTVFLVLICFIALGYNKKS